MASRGLTEIMPTNAPAPVKPDDEDDNKTDNEDE
jgi:hypothetical protein